VTSCGNGLEVTRGLQGQLPGEAGCSDGVGLGGSIEEGQEFRHPGLPVELRETREGVGPVGIRRVGAQDDRLEHVGGGRELAEVAALTPLMR
jgi:hypothetical protein